LPTSRSDDRWRVGRRILDRGLRPVAAATYRHMQQARAHVLLSRLLAHPQELVAHVELQVRSFLVSSAFLNYLA
jgi:hypothetical protein